MSLPTPSDAAAFWTSSAFWRRTGITTVAIWTGTALAFAGTVVAARGLGPRDFGRVVLAMSVAMLLATLLDLNLEEAAVHHGLRALQRGDGGALRALFRSAAAIDAGLGVAVGAVLVAAAGPIAWLFGAGELDPNLFRLAAVVMLAETMDGTTSGILLVARRPDLRAWSEAVLNLVRLAAVWVAVRDGGPAAVLIAFAAASAAGAVFQGVLAWWVALRRWPGRATPGGRWPRVLVPFGVWTSLTRSVLAARESVVPVLLNAAAGPPAVGILRVALFPVTFATVAAAPLGIALLPEQASLDARGRVDDLRRSVRGHALLGLAVGIGGAVAGWFALPWIVGVLYGGRFDAAIGPARILLVAAVATLAVGWSRTLPAAIGRPGVRARVAAFELVLTAGAVGLLASGGPVGAAAGISAAAVGAGVAWWIAAARMLDRREREMASCAAS